MAMHELSKVLSLEIGHLQDRPDIRDAYSPITWLKLCRYIQHATDGLTSVRLATEGHDTKTISEMTGIHPGRIAAFKAWNTMWLRAVRHELTIKWRKAEERIADITFLRSIGISVGDEATND